MGLDYQRKTNRTIERYPQHVRKIISKHAMLKAMDNKDIGALWSRTAKSGVEYFSGVVTIEGVAHKLVLFKNKNKKKDNHPDYHIFKSEPKAESSDTPF